MKLKSIFSLSIGVILSCAFVACSSDDDATTHTDASQAFVTAQSYKCTLHPLTTDSILLSDDDAITVNVVRHDGDSVQAVDITFTGTAYKYTKASINVVNKDSVFVPGKRTGDVTVDQSGVFNVAKANNGYTFVSGSASSTTGSALKKSSGHLSNDSLTFYVTFNSSAKFSTATAAKSYVLTGKKVATPAE